MTLHLLACNTHELTNEGGIMNDNKLNQKYKKALGMDMVFKDIPTAMDFLQDLGNKLPDMFEFSPPKNPEEYIRATEGGQTIILHKNKKMSTNGEVLPVVACQDFCNIIGKYTVWDIIDKSIHRNI